MKTRFYCVTALCLAVLAGCNRKPDAEKIVPVGVYEVGQSELSNVKSYMGSVRSERQHLALSAHNGSIQTLSVSVGQHVAADQVIAHVDAPDAQSLYASAQALLRQAEDGHARASKVHDAGGMSEIDWMDVETKLVQARSQAEVSQRSFERCDIKVPFAGTVSEVYATAGDNVTIGSRIALIIDESKLQIQIFVPENEYNMVHIGSRAEVEVPALDNAHIYGKVSDIGVNSTSLSHSYVASVSISDYPSSLKAGMSCRVYLETNNVERMVIPAVGVKVDDKGTYVWTVAADNTVEKRYITTGPYVRSNISITGGLEAGDRVICEGTAKVSTGMKVDPRLLNAE